MPNIYDVARRAQVSRSTVSNVLNDDPAVQPAIRKAVLEAMEELGYIPNAAARSLKNSRSGTIGFVVPDLENSVLRDVIEGVEEVVCDHHYSLLLCNSRRRLDLQRANVRRLLERRVEGIVLFTLSNSSRELETLRQTRLPVLIADVTGTSLNEPKMSINLQAGIQSGIEYLSRLGHERIAFIAQRAQPHSQRAEIYRQAMLGLGIPYDPSLVVFAGSNAECREGVSALLDRADRPTALFVSAGIFAPHALTRIYEAGMEIPSDLSFITVGETPWAAAHRPPLTTISHDAVGWGRMAGEYIFARIAGNDGSAVVHEVQSELIIRASCAPWRGR